MRNCGLLDVPCHLSNAGLGWWNGLEWYVQALIVVSLIAVIIGIAWSFLAFVKRIGGWPAVAGAVGLIFAALLALFGPKKVAPKSRPGTRAPTVAEDGTPVRKKPRTRTIFDMFKP